jgi:hypothetical protein
VPHATVPSLESCSSQNRIFPSTAFAGVIGFSAGTGTAGSGCADAASAGQSTSVASSTRIRVKQGSFEGRKLNP